MRRLMIAVGFLVVLFAAAPATSAAEVFNVRFSGLGAEGFWSTYPQDGAIVANTVYRDTFIGTSTQAVKSNGTATGGTSLFVDSLAYEFDRKGNFSIVSEVVAFH